MLTAILFTVIASLADHNVIVLRSDGAPGGAAVLVAPSLILTAAHVLKASIVAVVCGGKTVLPAAVIAIDVLGDIALLATPAPCEGTRISPIALTDPEPGTDLFAVGCPNQACGRLTKGIVSAYEEGVGSVGTELISDVKIWFGSSGGGLLDKDGCLVGIVSNVQRFTNPDMPGFDVLYAAAVPASRIRAWLKLEGINLQ